MAACGLDSVAAPSWVSPCMLMAAPAARLSLTRPSELARSLAADSTPLESEKVSAAPNILDDIDTTVGGAELLETRSSLVTEPGLQVAVCETGEPLT